ncbi:LysR family transcriptional regulator [Neglecta sp. X4]|uniref:LysR family transcriptional regulator n=1 Tax=unclassified Neglectibacter TaxID=2632164 RepID=UPI00136CB8DD|nr:LysR family transcriptional regulator [Neglectibacter sp. 59]NBJ73881.1 LysR family transcriptional regulator [Neglectibacter sp. X4]NCE80609.1 LysR family transcriptional regulator [Neglectibacter sp. X58]
MELRVLQYFLAVTREQNILRAAESLSLSQPTLSRQIRDMEAELGKQLFIRGSRSITLTEEGMILRKRAEEIMELVKKAEDEIALAEEPVSGSITVGAGETDGLRVLVRAVQALREEWPGVHFHVVSGDKCSVIEQLDGGLIDFGVVFGDFDKTKYEYIPVPCMEHFGVLMRKDDPLAERESIDPKELWNKPLIVSRQAQCDATLPELLGRKQEKLNIVGSYNLLFSGSLMVEEGMGYALAFDKIVDTGADSNLCFRPLSLQNEIPMFVLWKKYQMFTKAAEKFLIKLRELEDES